MSIRTGAAIITSVLARVGNNTPIMVTEAEAQLNNILDSLYDERFPFLRGSVSGTVPAGESTVNLPADFGDIWLRDSFWLYDSDGNRLPITVMSQPDFDISGLTTFTGTPNTIVIDPAANTFRTVPYSTIAYTYTLLYHKTFTPITDFTQVLEFPDDQLVEQLLFVWACQHEDDDRYTAELQISDQMLARSKKKWNRSALKQSGPAMASWRFKKLGVWR